MLFEILKRSPRPVNSLVTPASAAVRGIAMQESATAGTAELADGTKPFAGFLTRASQVGGPSLGDVIYPGRLELPFVAGQEGTCEFAEEIVVEGSDYINSSITGATPLETPASFVGGKFSTVSSAQVSQFILVELPTPDVAGNVRARFVTTAGSIKA